MSELTVKPCLIKASEGEARTMPGTSNRLKLPAGASGGAYCVMFDTLEPGVGPPPHVHANEDELFLIADGTFEFWIEGQTMVAHPGDMVFAPRGCKHAFKNAGDQTGHCWIIVNSGSFETFIAEFYAHMSQPEPDFGRAGEIGSAYGITFLPPGG